MNGTHSSRPSRRPAPPSERFWRLVERRGETECWHWLGTINEHGYGSFWDGTRLVRAHRFALELSGTSIERLVVDHVCHNGSGCQDVPCAHRRCVNPSHLEAVSQSVNSRRGRSGDHQAAKTACPSGHPYTQENTILRDNGAHRVCRECNRVQQARYNLKRKAS